MPRIFIEKPKRPVCFEPANMVVMFGCMIILFFLQIFFFLMYFVAMAVFCIISVNEFKHYPIATLYTKDGSLYYYKKGLTEIPLNDIKKVEVAFDNKHKPYIDITYDKFSKEDRLVINESSAQEIVDGINEEIAKSKVDKNNNK